MANDATKRKFMYRFEMRRSVTNHRTDSQTSGVRSIRRNAVRYDKAREAEKRKLIHYTACDHLYVFDRVACVGRRQQRLCFADNSCGQMFVGNCAFDVGGQLLYDSDKKLLVVVSRSMQQQESQSTRKSVQVVVKTLATLHAGK
jgi:hypothetical protein